MAGEQIGKFLSESVIARRATVSAKVVFRRTRMTPGKLRQALGAGEIAFSGQSICDLVAGGTVIATGEIVERDGHYFFQAKESQV